MTRLQLWQYYWKSNKYKIQLKFKTLKLIIIIIISQLAEHFGQILICVR